MCTFIEVLLFVADILIAFTACTLVIICTRKKNIHHDKQSVFYRKRILFSIIGIILSGCSIAMPILLKDSSYDNIGLPKIAFMISMFPAIITLIMSLVNIPALKDFPEVELTEEDIAFFQRAFSDVFTRIQKYSSETLTRLEKETASVPEHRAKYIICCVWYFFKHLLFNTIVSHASGTDPMYLDSGTAAFLKHERYVMKEPVYLACSAARELTAGVEKALKKLQTSNTDELRNVFAAFFAAYNTLKEKDSPVPENDVCHAGQIAYFMIVYLWTLQEKTLDKINVLYSVHKSNLGIPVNIYRELVSIIECRK